VALNAHVAAVIRSLRCLLISVGRISARAPQTAPLFQSRTETSTPVLQPSAPRLISPGTDCVCTVCFAVCCRSLLTTQRYFSRMCVCLLLSFSCCARSLCVSLLRVRACPPSLPRPNATHSTMQCPLYFLRVSSFTRRSCFFCSISARNVFLRPPICFTLSMFVSAVRFSMQRAPLELQLPPTEVQRRPSLEHERARVAVRVARSGVCAARPAPRAARPSACRSTGSACHSG
jgi:hypothetical protein